MPEVQPAPQKAVPQHKKGFIASLYIGLASIHLEWLVQLIFVLFISRSSISVPVLLLALLPIVSAIFAIYFLNRNRKISIILFIVYGILLLMGFGPLPGIMSFRLYSFLELMLLFISSPVIKFTLVILALYGLIKAKYLLAKICSLLLVAWHIPTLLACPFDISRIIGGGIEGIGILCAWLSYWGVILTPIALVVCSFKPGAIRGSIKFIDVVLSFRLLMTVVFCLLNIDFINLSILLEIFELCWLPIVAILCLNAVLLFPVSFGELASIFGKCFLVVGFIVLLTAGSVAVEENRRNAQREEEERRKNFLNTTRDHIQSWQAAGFSDTFTVEAAQSMLKEGRITYQEYQWLVSELIGKG